MAEQKPPPPPQPVKAPPLGIYAPPPFSVSGTTYSRVWVRIATSSSTTAMVCGTD